MLGFKLKTALAAVGALTLAVTVGSGTAFAGTNVGVGSTGSLNGEFVEFAHGAFMHEGELLEICDKAADGYRAVIQVMYSDSTGNMVFKGEETGGKDHCNGFNWSAPEGITVYIAVWRQDGADGYPRDIARGTAIA